MPLQVTIKVEDSEVRKMISRISSIQARTVDWLKNQAAPRMRQSFEENFRSEGRPEKWAPLKASTAKFRSEGRKAGWWNVGDYRPILQRTGDLMKMVINTKEDIIRGDKQVGMEMDPRKMLGKTGKSPHGGAESFEKHQLGIGGVRRRQIISIQNEDIDWLTNRYEDFLQQTINA